MHRQSNRSLRLPPPFLLHGMTIRFTFMLDCNGLQGYFTSVDGLGSEHEVVTGKYISKDGKEVQAKAPGRLTWGDVTLKRGITADMGIWEWRQLIVDGKVKDARKAVSVTLLDRTYSPVVTWNLTNAWPSKVSAMTLSADSNDFALEEVTLVHEGITREGVTGLPASRG